MNNTQHYFSQKPSRSFTKQSLPIHVLQQDFELYTATGLFSVKRLDPGTKLLIESIPKPTKKTRLLDLGCGNGVVGIVLQATYPQLEVSYSDINEHAIKCVKANLQKFQQTAQVHLSDGFSALNETYDCIALNPPFSAGRDVCIRLIKDSYEHLEKNGVLYIVARKNKGGDYLFTKMKESFENGEIMQRKSGFCVYASSKN